MSKLKSTISTAPQQSTVQQSHIRISSTYSKVRTTLCNTINSITGKYYLPVECFPSGLHFKHWDFNSHFRISFTDQTSEPNKVSQGCSVRNFVFGPFESDILDFTSFFHSQSHVAPTVLTSLNTNEILWCDIQQLYSLLSCILMSLPIKILDSLQQIWQQISVIGCYSTLWNARLLHAPINPNFCDFECYLGNRCQTCTRDSFVCFSWCPLCSYSLKVKFSLGRTC